MRMGVRGRAKVLRSALSTLPQFHPMTCKRRGKESEGARQRGSYCTEVMARGTWKTENVTVPWW